jgi:hypothetical protein
MTKPSDIHGVEDGAPPPVFTKGRDLDLEPPPEYL